MIDSKNISVIIQGPIEWTLDPVSGHGLTYALYQNIRTLLPDAEIILSTWQGQKVDDLGYDRLVLSKDPGPQGTWPSFVPNNVNRQIVSTMAGLNAASRKFCLKIRSDIVLKSTDFLLFFENAKPLKPDSRNIFTHPVLTNNFSSRNTSEILKRLPGHPLPFHPSDHVSFGLKEDLIALWNAPLQSEDDGYYFIDKSQPSRYRLAELSKLTPEQYIMTNAISKKIDIDIIHYADMRDEVIFLSEFYMSTHIISIPDRLFSIDFPKYHTPHHFHFEWMRRNPDPYLLKTYGISADEKKKRHKLLKPLRFILSPFRKSGKYLKQAKRLFTS